MVKKEIDKKKVVVAMSGGVDSSVAAALLKKQGYQVVGVFMHFWAEKGGKKRENLCCSAGAREAAKAVAKKLDMPFYEWHFEKEFKKAVVDYFLAEERHGRTPNPCVVCNKKIKFGLLFQKALAIGADYVATGHYTRLRREFPISNFQFPNKSQILNSKKFFKLFRAKDTKKDQSYFLYILTQRQLSRILFPLGDYTKEEVYQMAKKWRLPFRQEESFDLCFVGRDRKSFIKRYLKQKPGKIINLAGDVLGEHQGFAYYTIGQRKNLPLYQGPWWVVKKDEDKNILYVSNNEKDLYSKELLVDQINWVSGKQLKLPVRVLAKIRYKSEAAEAVINQKPETPAAEQARYGAGRNQKLIKVKFKKPQRAVTPGQSAVFCSKNGEVLGGGIIN